MVSPTTSSGFTVSARTVLELGAELISSDAIALYELIKNAYDAGSNRVSIRISCVFRQSSLRNMNQRIDAAVAKADLEDDEKASLLGQLVGEIESLIDQTASLERKESFRQTVKSAVSLEGLKSALKAAYDAANQIDIVDVGEGMSLHDLQTVFLTIGTTSRLEDPSRHYVGGKGIGRLSTMRLADHITVITSRSGEAKWNVLDVEWERFAHTSSVMLEEIEVRPIVGETKDAPEQSGTTIRLRGLRADWDQGRVERIARNQMDRLFDPFGQKRRYPVLITVNSRPVRIPTFDKRLLIEAQAKASINYYINDDGPNFALTIDYLAHNRTITVHWNQTDILGITAREDVSLEAMVQLGPFTGHFHWFNRQKLTALDGVGTRNEVRELVNHWANGLLMYRDGFRVNPYGAPDDDWLGIDFRALGSAGYKVNRKQLIGAVYISASANPMLIDQTNREGLRTNEEKTVLVTLMQKAVTEEFRNFLNRVDREARASARLGVQDTSKFLDTIRGKVRQTLKALSAAAPASSADDIKYLDLTFVELEERLKTARDAVQTAEREQRDLVNLAGIGLLVEIVSHELGRVAKRTLEILGDIDRAQVPSALAATFDSVENQMIVIRKRLDMLNPLSPSGRNRREEFDLVELVMEILNSHSYQFEQANISASCQVVPSPDRGFNIKAVKGMIVQVIENLLDNSLFWLGQQMRSDPSFRGKISIEIDTADSQLLFTDNGPGIATGRAEEVFRPFVSSKPPGEGKGLGLYISKEIARYHGSDLFLLDAPRSGRLNTFVLDINGMQ
ncbi:signal transduction histidine kinase [Rhizobium leguminosarum]|uniref:sensor histidine kinase n=1 Tax=Rhizobium leguminosarum TaxID=384 RepID=UPI0016100E6B|nr:HAMP domain-containing sensor histidine kinase [Rhizobium leguminosarum]MBB4388542.1 signal transduction histidine kinase [Rhizobium leguminosarum]